MKRAPIVVLEVDSLTVCAQHAGRAIVLDRVSLTAAPGEILAVLGPNGAGKTTLLEALVHLRPVTSGSVRWKGRALTTFADRAATFAFMPDEAVFPEEASVRLVLGGEHGEDLGVAPLWDRSAGELSRGESKRVWLAWALALDRPVVVLDEPFAAFDPVQMDGVLDVVRKRARAGSTVIVSIHQMATAERVADRILLIAEGKVVAFGTLAELRELAGSGAGTGACADASLEEVFRALVAKA
jgi:ABC-type multidrug transport system ATPase subunit